MSEIENVSVIKTYSVDMVTIQRVREIVKKYEEMGRSVSQGEVLRIAVKLLWDSLIEAEAAEAEVERDEYELEATAAEMGTDYE